MVRVHNQLVGYEHPIVIQTLLWVAITHGFFPPHYGCIPSPLRWLRAQTVAGSFSDTKDPCSSWKAVNHSLVYLTCG